MYKIILSCLLLIAIASTAQAAKCLYAPIGYIPNGCSVLNLTVTSKTGETLLVDWRCNRTVDISGLEYPPAVSFTNVVMPSSRNQTYFLAMMDKTTSQLLWMVANITAVDKILAPGTYPWYGRFKNSMILRSYHPPILNVTSNNHSIEFLVFEERYPGRGPSIHLSSSDFNMNHPFNLREWLQKQSYTGTVFCGPVAGGQLVVNQKFSYTPVHPQPYPYPHQPQHYPQPPQPQPPYPQQPVPGSHYPPPPYTGYPQGHSVGHQHKRSIGYNMHQSTLIFFGSLVICFTYILKSVSVF